MKSRIDMIVFGLCVIACVLALACIIQIRRYNAVQEEEPFPPHITHTAWSKWVKKKRNAWGNRIVNDGWATHGAESLVLSNVVYGVSTSYRTPKWYHQWHYSARESEPEPAPEHIALKTARAATNDTKQIVSIRYEYEDGSTFSWNKTNRVILE